MLYKCAIKNKVRTVIVVQDMPIDAALDFLKGTPKGIVLDSTGETYTKEELLNVRSFGSKHRTKPHSGSTSAGKVSKNTNSKLSELIRDNTE